MYSIIQVQNMKALAIENQKFGKLTALEVVSVGKKRKWRCSCECGGEIITDTFQLTSGNVVQCKNPWHKSSIQKGDIFGKLTVLDIQPDYKNKRSMFLCKCDCGNEKIVSARNLQRGATTHCGCSKAKRKYSTPAYMSSFNSLVASYAANAKNKNLEFSLTPELMHELFKGSCFFCGCAPKHEYTRKNFRGSYTYNGIDRIDSSKGYTPDNVNSCCSDCNYLKGNRTNEEFLKHIKKIVSNVGW